MKGRRLAVILSAVSVVVLAFLSLFAARGVYFKSRGEDKPVIGALFVAVDINIKCSDGAVSAVANNRLTVFTGTVETTVTLYCSDVAPISDISEMTVAAVNFDGDLDFAESLTASFPLNGTRKYWEAEIKWRVDGGKEHILRTSVICYGADGEVIEKVGPCTW